MKRLELSLLIGIVMAICLTSLGLFGNQAEDIRGEVVRLHVLANSDSEEDQQLKLEVRDALLLETQDIFIRASDREEAEALAFAGLERMEVVARETIRGQGYDYQVDVKLVNMYFETRQYGDVSLPAGRYDAVRVEIGRAAGQNWWCVMFPPMCLPAATEHEDLPLEDQIRQLGEQPRYVPKFAVVELIESIHNRLGGGEDETLLPAALPSGEQAVEPEAEGGGDPLQ